jgi:hypothetical protein
VLVRFRQLNDAFIVKKSIKTPPFHEITALVGITIKAMNQLLLPFYLMIPVHWNCTLQFTKTNFANGRNKLSLVVVNVKAVLKQTPFKALSKTFLTTNSDHYF